MNIGIYTISCSANSKFYIGSSVEIKKRFRSHRNSLAAGQHQNIYLQRAWNKYGSEAFSFAVVEYVEDPLQLVPTEQRWIDTYWNQNVLFNLSPTAGSPLGVKHTEATKAKLRLRPKRQPNLGNRHSDATKQKMSNDRTGSKNAFYGRTHSEATKERYKSLFGKKYLIVTPSDQNLVITNLKQFCRENDLHQGSMWRMANGKTSAHHKGYQCYSMEPF